MTTITMAPVSHITTAIRTPIITSVMMVVIITTTLITDIIGVRTGRTTIMRLATTAAALHRMGHTNTTITTAQAVPDMKIGMDTTITSVMTNVITTMSIITDTTGVLMGLTPTTAEVLGQQAK